MTVTVTVTVTDLQALEILDSRGRPTLAVTMTLTDGTVARAGVRSGTSTGSREAVELRDGDPGRFEGRGVLGAVESVNGEIAQTVIGRTFVDLADLDHALIDLDGSENKSRLGANAIVGVSMVLTVWGSLSKPASLSMIFVRRIVSQNEQGRSRGCLSHPL